MFYYQRFIYVKASGSAFRIIFCGSLYFYLDFGYNVNRMPYEMEVSMSMGFGMDGRALAVQKADYAVRVYEKVGFKTVDENDEEYIWKSYIATRESKG